MIDPMVQFVVGFVIVFAIAYVAIMIMVYAFTLVVDHICQRLKRRNNND